MSTNKPRVATLFIRKNEGRGSAFYFTLNSTGLYQTFKLSEMQLLKKTLSTYDIVVTWGEEMCTILTLATFNPDGEWVVRNLALEQDIPAYSEHAHPARQRKLPFALVNAAELVRKADYLSAAYEARIEDPFNPVYFTKVLDYHGVFSKLDLRFDLTIRHGIRGIAGMSDSKLGEKLLATVYWRRQKLKVRELPELLEQPIQQLGEALSSRYGFMSKKWLNMLPTMNSRDFKLSHKVQPEIKLVNGLVQTDRSPGKWMGRNLWHLDFKSFYGHIIARHIKHVRLPKFDQYVGQMTRDLSKEPGYKPMLVSITGKLNQPSSFLYDPIAYHKMLLMGGFHMTALMDIIHTHGGEVLWAKTDGLVVKADKRAIEKVKLKMGFPIEVDTLQSFIQWDNGNTYWYGEKGITTRGAIWRRCAYLTHRLLSRIGEWNGQPHNVPKSYRAADFALYEGAKRCFVSLEKDGDLSKLKYSKPSKPNRYIISRFGDHALCTPSRKRVVDKAMDANDLTTIDTDDIDQTAYQQMAEALMSKVFSNQKELF